ncbi:hypothetical protein [Yeosuana sp.]|uniref:hypothetical protein n=1 Tax=Yeosuana sp. TaxID=2529388 RepID=UPI004054AAE0|tara:strand:- start:2359 stop:2670 length:312 start_codon:yes stop_codon:yes gene_type:complete
MASKKSRHITVSNVDNWISSLGFSFPRNQNEEKLFDKLYKDFDHELTGKEIDPLKLIKQCEEESELGINNHDNNWKMAARNYDGLPLHIIDKMKKNHDDKDKT